MVGSIFSQKNCLLCICSQFYQIQVSIWEERKVFGSRGQILKEEFVGRQVDNGNRDGKQTVFKPVKYFSLC